MKRSSWFGAAGFLAFGTVAGAAELYVDAASSGAELGTQQSPYRSVQAAIDAAAAGDEVRVAAGAYVQNLRIEGKAVVLRGGFSRTWVRDPAANPTTLMGAGGDAVINLIASDATIDGFRITGGAGSTDQLPYGYHGGGIYSRDGSPTISNCTIENNDIRTGEPPFDYFFGGGIYVSNCAQANIIGNVLRGNVAGRGGAIAIIGQRALIQGNTIENNVAVGDHGGGLFVAVVNATITRNIIRGNEVGAAIGYGWGGGLIIVGAGNSAELSFNVLHDNFAAAYGAAEFIDEGAFADIHHELIYRNKSKDGCEAVSAIAVDGGDGVGSEANIRHCTVVDNVCDTAIRGNGLQVEGRSIARVTNSIFWNNGGDDFATDATSTLSISYTCSQERADGVGNISADPRFLDPGAADYRLAAGSPCLNAADPASPFADEPADNGGRADMGRFGNAKDALPQPPAANSGSGSADSPSDQPGGNTTGNGASGGQAGSANDASSGGTANPDSGHANSGSSAAHTPPTPEEVLSPTGMCPAAAGLLFSLSLLGSCWAGRKRRRA